MLLDVEYVVDGVRFKFNQAKSVKNKTKRDRGHCHRAVARALLTSIDSMDNPGYPGQILEFVYIDGVMFTVATDDGYDEVGDFFGIYTYWKTGKALERQVLANG